MVRSMLSFSCSISKLKSSTWTAPFRRGSSAQNLQLSIEEKQELLEIFDPAERLNRIADVLDIEIEKLNMDRTIQSRVKRQMERAQKEYYLNEKIKAIQKELGRGE